MMNVASTWGRLGARILVALALVGATGAFAQPYPSRPITLVVQAAPGGAADLTARQLAQKVTASLGQPVTILNEPAAAGVLAVQRVMRAKPDGYTLLMLGSKSAIAVAGGRLQNVDLLKQLAPVSFIGSSDVVIVTDPKSRFKRLGDLVQEIKARPGTVKIGVGDVAGGIQHLMAELFKLSVQGDFVIVPFGTMANLYVAVQSGEVDAGVELLAAIFNRVKGGEVRALAVSGSHVHPDLRDVPTAAEAGVAAFEGSTNSFIAAPAGTPPAVIERLNREINLALRQPDSIQAALARGSRVPDPVTPQQAAELLAREMTRWMSIVRQANVRLE